MASMRQLVLFFKAHFAICFKKRAFFPTAITLQTCHTNCVPKGCFYCDNNLNMFSWQSVFNAYPFSHLRSPSLLRSWGNTRSFANFHCRLFPSVYLLKQRVIYNGKQNPPGPHKVSRDRNHGYNESQSGRIDNCAFHFNELHLRVYAPC